MYEQDGVCMLQLTEAEVLDYGWVGFFDSRCSEFVHLV